MAHNVFTARGTYFRDDAMLRSIKENDAVEFVPEPDNVFDSNAVKVVIGGKHVGYWPAELCQWYRDHSTLISNPVVSKIAANGHIIVVSFDADEHLPKQAAISKEQKR